MQKQFFLNFILALYEYVLSSIEYLSFSLSFSVGIALPRISLISRSCLSVGVPLSLQLQVVLQPVHISSNHVCSASQELRNCNSVQWQQTKIYKFTSVFHIRVNLSLTAKSISVSSPYFSPDSSTHALKGMLIFLQLFRYSSCQPKL